MSDQKYMPSFNIAEPTEDEIEETIENLKEKYDIVISKEDAIQYTKLSKEFEQWFLIEKDIDSPDSIIEDMAKRIQGHIKETLKKEITLEDARKLARQIAETNIPNEKEQIGKELKAIITKYQ